MKPSVIICTLNPRRANRERPLAALRARTLQASNRELVVFANDSAPPLASWAAVHDLPKSKIHAPPR